jgi:3-methylcrotonyl-CoA carboxylase alpha subunit
MKMEHVLVAARDGVVASIAVSEGQQVNQGALLVSLEPGVGGEPTVANAEAAS